MFNLGRQRNISIDVLRGVAILLVLSNHLPPVDGTLSSLLEYLCHEVGWVGVELFFVLSGFLITNILIEDHYTYRGAITSWFLMRRALKILPSYLLLLTFSSILLVKTGNFSEKLLLAEVFLVHGYFPSLLPHTWSIAAEVHFYLIISLLIAHLIRKDKIKLLPKISLAVILGELLLRIVIVNFSLQWRHDSYIPSVVRMDSFFIGVIGAYITKFHLEKCQKIIEKKIGMFLILVILFSIGITISVDDQGYLYAVIGYPIFAFSFLLILLTLVVKQEKENIFTHWLSWLGRYSYNIYLWHMPVVMWFVPKFNLSKNLSFLIYFVLSILVGVIVTEFWEKPFLNLKLGLIKRRFFRTLILNR